MTSLVYKRGCVAALKSVGIWKSASSPQMGEALYETLTPATKDPPLTEISNQTASAFSEHDKQLFQDPQKNAVDIEALKRRSPIPVIEHDVAKHFGGGVYAPRGFQEHKDPFIGHTQDASPNVIAHEIGHALSEQSALGRAVNHPISRGAYFLNPLLTPVVASQLKSTKARAIGIPLTALGLSLPTLASEGMASYKGHQVLEDLGATPEELSDYRNQNILNGLSYAVLPVGSAVLGGTTTRIQDLLKNAAYKLDDRTTFRGLQISIENKAGSYREWMDSSTGEKGRTLQKYPYGYIRLTEGMDGDHVDCYVGPNQDATHVYVITTNKAPDFKYMDEQKCMLGFNSAEEAKKVFLEHYNDPRFFHSMKAFPFDEFKSKVLATKGSANKKLASNFNETDHQKLIQTGPGTFAGQVPGDRLGLPHSSLVGMRSIVGDSLSVSDKIDKGFRDMDMPSNITSLDDSTAVTGEHSVV